MVSEKGPDNGSFEEWNMFSLRSLMKYQTFHDVKRSSFSLGNSSCPTLCLLTTTKTCDINTSAHRNIHHTCCFAILAFSEDGNTRRYVYIRILIHTLYIFTNNGILLMIIDKVAVKLNKHIT